MFSFGKLAQRKKKGKNVQSEAITALLTFTASSTHLQTNS
jgi:hypothetical protein